jgi:hypothetical protein
MRSLILEKLDVHRVDALKYKNMSTAEVLVEVTVFLSITFSHCVHLNVTGYWIVRMTSPSLLTR